DTDARVGAAATVADSVLGQRVHLGDGVALPGATTDVRVGDRVHTDVRLGAVVADGARLGGGATAAPGSLVGPDARVGAGAHVDGNVAAGVEVRR
ncbi:MAG: nucleotidyl transferase, partial [Haloferacaceae archaeon]